MQIMKKINSKLRISILVIVILAGCLSVSAENTTGGNTLTNLIATSTVSPGTSYITIDPIGNHTIGEVFFIHGTTNLPASLESLEIQIGTANVNPGGWGPSFHSNVSIQPGENGVNHWSCNATVGQGWNVYPRSGSQESISERVGDSVGIGADESTVYVTSTETFATQSFFLIPPERSGTQSETLPVVSPSAGTPVSQQPTSVPSALPVTAPVVALGICCVIGRLYRIK
jgi:hypothetical protein